MEQLLLLLVIAEAITENIKWVIDGFKSKVWDWGRLISLVVSVVVCALVGADLFAMVGWPMALPYSGAILTGFAVSRGANVIHDITKLPLALTERKGSG